MTLPLLLRQCAELPPAACPTRQWCVGLPNLGTECGILVTVVSYSSVPGVLRNTCQQITDGQQRIRAWRVAVHGGAQNEPFIANAEELTRPLYNMGRDVGYVSC